MTALNPRQTEAVRFTDGPLLVLAGAGSGKTSVITHKIGWLLDHCGFNPANIAAVTFTNKAAREMQTRVAATRAGRPSKGLTISTFHMLGLKFLRSESARAGLKSGFGIFDSEDSLLLIRELMRKELSADAAIAEKVRWQISQWKNAMRLPEEIANEAWTLPIQASAAVVYSEYQRHLRAYNACDFDDLILQPVVVLRRDPEVLARMRARIQYLLVDEYQDTNACQYELVKLLVGGHLHFTVVGDDDQSVYAWRGARPENLQQLSEDFPTLKIVKLEQNYRSSGRILKAANSLIARNPHVFEKSLWSELGFGDQLRVLRTRNEEDEAERVIAELLHHKFIHRTEFRDYAILYRGNHQARPFEKILREQHVTYFLSGGTSFFERSEVRDLMAYLRLIANPDDDNAFLRIVNTPRREIGPATLEKLALYAGTRGVSLYGASSEVGLTQHLNERGIANLRRFTDWLAELIAAATDTEDPIKIVRRLLSDLDYAHWLQETCGDAKAAERRMENVLELVAWMEKIAHKDSEKQFADIVANITLMGMLDRDGDNNDNSVSLMTLHAAKGLEFPHVFIVGMEEELLPHRTSIAEDNIEEERRLAYVGITRAKKTLTFSFATKRKRHGEIVDREPSRFLSELPPDDLHWDGDGAQDPEGKRAHGAAQLAQLRGLLE